MNIIDINKLSQTTISDIDALFIHNINESETKFLSVSDLCKYVISHPNLTQSLKSGNFTGNFHGNLIGNVTNASSSVNSSYSINSRYLNYPNNSTSSYSILSLSADNSDKSLNSISSSHSISSRNSITSSYANICVIQQSLTSALSKLSIVSGVSTSSDYLIYDGKYNGVISKSIISEYSPTSSIGKSLSSNYIFNDPTQNINYLINDSKANSTVLSTYSRYASTSKYIKFVENSDFSSYAYHSDSIPFAYINFKISHTNGKDWKFSVTQYKNIRDPGVGLARIPTSNDTVAIFTGSYDMIPGNNYQSTKQSSTAILAETSFNFPYDDSVNYWFNTFSFPMSNQKFAIGIKVDVVLEESSDNILLSLLNNASISVVMFANATGKQSSDMVKTTTHINSALLDGCAKI